MFGYVRVSKPELRIKEFELYKSVYCSLCKRLGKDYGFISRFALNYDFTFTALLELAFVDKFDGTHSKRCVCNPLKKCNYCIQDKEFALSSAALVILGYYKICDDIEDEKWLKRLKARFLKLLFKSSYKKALKNYPNIDKIAKEYFEAQKAAEKNTECDLDTAAEPSSVMLSKLLPMCALNGNDKKVLEFLGRLLGRYIYLLDCLCDYDKDVKKGAFNPVKHLSYEKAKEKITGQIYILIGEAEKAFELLEIKRFKNIIGNIIYVGLEDTMKNEITRLEKKK